MLDHHSGMWCHVLHLVFMSTHHVCVQVTWVFHYLGSSHLRHLYILKDLSVIYMTFLLTIPISIYLSPHWHVLLHNCLHISWFVCCKILSPLNLRSVLDWEIWTPNKNNVSAWLPCPFHFPGSPCKSKCQHLEWTFWSWVLAGRQLQYSSNKDDILQAREKPCFLEIRH